MNLTVFCCLLDTNFILWGVMAETHEVKPVTHQNNRAVFLYTCSHLLFMDKGSQCPVAFIPATHHAGIITFLLSVTGIDGLRKAMNTWHSALRKTRAMALTTYLRTTVSTYAWGQMNLTYGGWISVKVSVQPWLLDRGGGKGEEGKKKFHKMNYLMENVTSVITPYPRKWRWKQKSFLHIWFFFLKGKMHWHKYNDPLCSP